MTQGSCSVPRCKCEVAALHDISCPAVCHIPICACTGGEIFRFACAIDAANSLLSAFLRARPPSWSGGSEGCHIMSVAVRLMCSDIGQNDGGKPAPQVPQPKGLSIKGRTAQIVNGKLVMVDATSEDGVSYPSASPELLAASTSATQNGEAPVASTSRASTPSPSSKTTASRPKLQRRQTRYFCTWEGCLKSYAKPVRLEEHLRSHTGERPYKCSYEGCGASYLRDTHLVAHMRTHLDEKDKPFKCEVGDCDKKFWTNQHLNRHVKLVHEQNNGAYKVSCVHTFLLGVLT